MSTNEEHSSDESVTSLLYHMRSNSKKNVEVIYIVSSDDEGEGEGEGEEDDKSPPALLDNNKMKEAMSEVSVDNKSLSIKDNMLTKENNDVGIQKADVHTVKLERSWNSTKDIMDLMKSEKIGRECDTSSTDIHSSQSSCSPVKFCG